MQETWTTQDYALAIQNKLAEIKVAKQEREDFEPEEWKYVDSYDEMLDECNEIVTICGMEYLPSRVLKECDPIAYNCGLSDYVDSIRDDIPESIELDQAIETLEEELEELNDALELFDE